MREARQTYEPARSKRPLRFSPSIAVAGFGIAGAAGSSSEPERIGPSGRNAPFGLEV